MTRLATGLDDVDKQVAILRDQLSASTREASEIEIGLKKARETLGVSQNLVLELADEYDRWRLQVIILFDKEEDVESQALFLEFPIVIFYEKFLMITNFKFSRSSSDAHRQIQ